jgi:mRNA-degrading endonuclease YafQ of YafQ-DinJ toxin-antitoxin module
MSHHPDWLLIYRIDSEDLILERTGSHAELFG